MKRLFPGFLCIFLLLSGCSQLQNVDIDDQQVAKVEASSKIQVIAKKPYIKRGETGVLALKCEPGATCQIVAVYKISGTEYRAARTMVADKDGSVICTWKVDKDTDTGTYEIEITSVGTHITTTYVVQ